MNRISWLVFILTTALTLQSSAQLPAEKPLRAADVKAKWSHKGRVRRPFHNCIQINEPADPQKELWEDNYLCFDRPDHGFQYSVSGPISGMRCVNLDVKGGVWADNYLCSDRVDFAWFGRKLKRGYICIRIVEPEDPHPRANSEKWNNAFCIKK